MAEPYQPLSVSTGSAQQAIQSTPNVTPNLDGLMQGIRDGFISADDIRKRVSSGPLEAATRQQDLADVTQVRPIQREAATAQLENVRAKEQFEAESLPILNDTKREALKQDYENVLQHGHPKAVMDLFNKTVPGFIEYDSGKLFPKTGGVNTAYALETLTKAFTKANKIKEDALNIVPIKQVNVSPTGSSVETQTMMNRKTGAVAGQPIVTETKAAKEGANTKEIKSSRLSKDGTVEEETVQRYNVDTGQLIGEPAVIGSKPVKLTQEQANALQFSDRMGFNNALVSDLTVKGFDPTSLKTTVQSYLFNRWQPEALQSYTAAKDNWITAALRKESGAAISPTEYTQANKEYFPRDGDSASVVKQKEALRFLVEEDIRLSTPGAGFWNPGNRDTRPGAAAAAAAASGAPTTPGVAPASPGVAAAPAPVITATDEAEAAAQANELPATVPFFQWNGETYRNPKAPR